MEDDLRKIMQPKTIIFLKMEDDLNFFETERRPHGTRPPKKCNQKQLKVKTMVVAPLRVT